MVKIIQPEIPPEWQEMWDRIFRWFQRNGVPIWARNWFQDTTRGANDRRRNSVFTIVSQYWNGLSPADQEQWKLAAVKVWGQRRGYRLFSMDLIWRRANNLGFPGTANLYHQLFGLKMSNPGGAMSVIMRIDKTGVQGQSTLNFSYKKNELTPTSGEPFRVNIGAFYFGSGELLVDVSTWTAPSGDISWTEIEHNFGYSDRDYYHIIVMFILDFYNADIFFDNIKITDSIGVIESENFITKRYVPYEPDFIVRKDGWGFSPEYAEPYFKYLYLE